MSPRTARDSAAIRVDIQHGPIGSGRQGGGELRGGLRLYSGFDADIDDPAVPYAIHLKVCARDGWLVCESATVTAKPDGPAVTSLAIRHVALGVYIQRVREELEEYAGVGGHLLMKETGRTDHSVSYEPPDGEEMDAFHIAQARRTARAATLTPEMAAEAYREALASPDPGQNQRPTAAAAERLGVSRGHVSRLVSQARRAGSAGLGPMRAARRKGDAAE